MVGATGIEPVAPTVSRERFGAWKRAFTFPHSQRGAIWPLGGEGRNSTNFVIGGAIETPTREGFANGENQLYQMERPCRQNRPSPKPSERNRHSGRKSGGRSACAVSRLTRKSARNLGFFRRPKIGERGWEGTDWSGQGDSNPRPHRGKGAFSPAPPMWGNGPAGFAFCSPPIVMSKQYGA